MFARAMAEQRIDMVMAEAANIVFARDDFEVLADDAGAFPPCEASFVLRSDADLAYPGARRALAEMSGKFRLESVRAANLKVIESHMSVDIVASGFLREAGLVP
jgi:glycine betaine/choline ABC-type transport system substrate-binding protein